MVFNIQSQFGREHDNNSKVIITLFKTYFHKNINLELLVIFTTLYKEFAHE